jgi:hypothetical protein
MSEIIFLIEEAVDGGLVARSLGQSIFTEAESMEELKVNIKDAVLCHFEEDSLPKVIRLHYVKDEVMSLRRLGH